MCFKENIGCKHTFFNMMTRKMNQKKLTKDISSKCTCKFDERIFYSN